MVAVATWRSTSAASPACPALPIQIFNGIPLPDGIGQRASHRVQRRRREPTELRRGPGARSTTPARSASRATTARPMPCRRSAAAAEPSISTSVLHDVGGQRRRRGHRRPPRRRRRHQQPWRRHRSVHDGDLVTEGDNTPGALVQSIGGGGGRANLALTSSSIPSAPTSLTLGGENGNERGRR